MIVDAAKIGANAVLGMRYEFNFFAEDYCEVLCYWTGVVLARGGSHWKEVVEQTEVQVPRQGDSLVEEDRQEVR